MKIKMDEKTKDLIEQYIIYTFILIIIICIFIKISDEKKNIINPEKTNFITTELASVIPLKKKELTVEVYAGRHATSKDKKYNSLGLPKNRSWLTHKEWRGKHIKNMPIEKDNKRLLLKRFKVWKKDHIKSFIKRMAKTAVEECNTYPEIPPSLIIAQAILESNFGLSKLAIEANNLFGHKYRGKDTHKFIIAHDDSPNDRFTKYKSIWFSLRAHTKGVLMKRYYPRIKGSPNLYKWLAALCGGMTVKESKQWVKDGNSVYATSCMTETCYSQKLMSVIKTYNLQIFDKNG